MKKLIIVLFFLLIFNMILKINEKNIRFRVIPNSNSIQDIFIKEKVLDISKKYIYNTNVDRKAINKITDLLGNDINNLFKEYNYNREFNIKYDNNYFPKKEYNGKYYPDGYYESLVIEIGEAKGDNYWCFLYPNICFMDENIEPSSNSKIKFESYFKKIISKII